jgi:cell division protein FtsL
MGILASIVVMLAITLIPALRSTMNQQSQISGLRESIAQQREQVAALQAEQKRWDDPAYVEQQARERLKFVRVGEKSYTVIDGDAAAVPDLTGGAQMAAPTSASAASIPWYGQLWQSVLISDTPSQAASGQSGPAPGAP